MFQELDTVVLRHDMDKYGLKRGNVGAVVHCYKDEAAFEVEFVATGRTRKYSTCFIAYISQPSIEDVTSSHLWSQ